MLLMSALSTFLPRSVVINLFDKQTLFNFLPIFTLKFLLRFNFIIVN